MSRIRVNYADEVKLTTMRHFLSRYPAANILKANDGGERSVAVSLDLGLTKSEVLLDGDSAVLPGGVRVPLRTMGKISSDQSCYMVDGGEVFKLQFYLPKTRRMYRLLATGEKTAPTAELGGFRMHRVKGTDPISDTKSKIALIRPVRGRVLDTCTGLGYTAIEALSAGAKEVVSVEVDEGMVRLREVNPWSAGLGDSRIKLITGDILSQVLQFEDGQFDNIIHDPPSMNIAGELYSLKFYLQLHRILRYGGKLFHYVGAPGSIFRGKKPSRGVIERLREAGFTKVAQKKGALGVLAYK
jgi:uncharacterized protein